MLKSLYLLLEKLLGNSIARMLSGAGFAVVSYAALMPLVLGALNLAASALQGLPADVLQLVGLSGLGEAITAIGSAMLTRTAIQSSGIGLKKAAKT